MSIAGKSLDFDPPAAQNAGPMPALRAVGLRSWTARRLERLAPKLTYGRLRLVLPDGGRLEFAGVKPGVEATVVMHRWRALRRLALGGDIGFAEAYIDGDWSSPDIVAIIRLAAKNGSAFDAAMRGSRALRWIERLRHFSRSNSRLGSRTNILAHYDLGNDFYRRWLDASMMYSSAIWTSETPDLEAAQALRVNRIVERLGVERGQSVLEIGCGWGALANRLAEAGAGRVTALTLSPSQSAWARASARERGFADTVDVRLQDYRDVEGVYDRIVSIEMIEAVGEAWWPTYFATLRRSLKAGGRAVIQAITIAEDRFENYLRTPDFIQKHVFPGGLLPTKRVIAERAKQAGLTLVGAEWFAPSYALTLAEWRRRFEAEWDEIAKLGFDARFRRLWRYYLSYCEAGFAEGAIDVGLYTIERAS
jgi:cyclopropane-fatty-acyl-phospholipid synthase